MKRKGVVIAVLAILLIALLFFSFATVDTSVAGDAPERTIMGKGMDGFGNTWLIVTCDGCQEERINVPSLDGYTIGDKLP
jgi:hypothetical protein